MPKMDDSKLGTPFVVTGLLHMVEDEGFSAREAFEILEDIKKQTFFALLEVQKGGITHASTKSET